MITVEAWLVRLTLFIIMIGLTLIATASIMSDGKIEHCYVDCNVVYDRDDVKCVVRGFVPWRPNITIARASTPEEAHQRLIELCPVKSQTNER